MAKLKKRTEPKVIIVARDVQLTNLENNILSRMRDYKELQSKIRGIRGEIEDLGYELEMLLLDESTFRDDIRQVVETWISTMVKEDAELYQDASEALAETKELAN
jgi:hypothetical protein